jgi:hypothetical protein
MTNPLLGQAPPPAATSGGGAAPPPPPPGPPAVIATPTLLGLCAALTVLGELREVAPPRWVAGHMAAVVKALNRCSREIAQSPAGPNHQAHYQSLVAAAAAARQQDAAAAAARAPGVKGGRGDGKDAGAKAGAGDKEAAPAGAAPKPKGKDALDADKDAAAAAAGAEDPEYGSVTWAVHSALGLAGSLLPGFNPEAPPAVLEDPALALTKDEGKRMLLQSLILLLTGSGAKWTDASLFAQARGRGGRGPGGAWRRRGGRRCSGVCGSWGDVSKHMRTRTACPTHVTHAQLSHAEHAHGLPREALSRTCMRAHTSTHAHTHTHTAHTHAHTHTHTHTH